MRKKHLPYFQYFIFIFSILYSTSCSGQISIQNQYKIHSFSWETLDDCTAGNCDEVRVEFTLELDSIDRAAGVRAHIRPSYKFFIDHGDGTYFEDSLAIGPQLTVAGGGISAFSRSIAASPPNRILYQHTHSYRAAPSKSPTTYASVIYTSGSPPPPARIGKGEVGNVFLALKTKLEQAGLPPAPTAEIIQPNAGQIDLYINRPAVPEEYMMGVLTYHNPPEAAQIDKGRILMFYNLGQFMEHPFQINDDSIRTYKGEVPANLDYNQFIESFPNTQEVRLPPNEFDNVLQIKFTDLEPGEKRKIFIPIFCPAEMIADTTKEAFFLSVLLDSIGLDEFLKLPNLIDVQESGGPSFDFAFAAPIPKPESAPNIPVDGLGLTLLNIHKKRYVVQPASTLTNNTIDEGVLDTHQKKTPVKVALDPNEINVSPSCFSKKNADLFCTVDFENLGKGSDGLGIAQTVTILVKTDGQIKNELDKIQLVDYYPKGDISIEEIRGDSFKVIISGICLGGVNDTGCDNFGWVKLKLKTKNITTADRKVVLDARIKFDDLAWFDVPKKAVAEFNNGKGCEPRKFYIPLPASGMRLGVQRPLNIGDMSFSKIEDNYFYGVFWDPFRIGNRAKLRLEFNLANMGLKDDLADGVEYKIRTFGGTAQLHFLLKDKWSMGLGGGIDWRSKVFKDDVEIGVDNQQFDKKLYSGFVDLNYNFANVSYGGVFDFNFYAGFRANTYIKPVINGNTQDFLFAPQLYLVWGF